MKTAKVIQLQPISFNEFYSHYPRHVCRAAALKAWPKAISKASASDIIEACKAFAAAMDGKDRQFIPHASTWLNGERWDDDIADIAPGAVATQTQKVWAGLSEAQRHKHQELTEAGTNRGEWAALAAYRVELGLEVENGETDGRPASTTQSPRPST